MKEGGPMKAGPIAFLHDFRPLSVGRALPQPGLTGWLKRALSRTRGGRLGPQDRRAMTLYDRLGRGGAIESRASVLADRSQFFKDITVPFYGSKASQGMRDAFWRQGMLAGYPNVFACIKAFSETDFTRDLEKFDVPTLIVHGDEDLVAVLTPQQPDVDAAVIAAVQFA